jgi:hypothetical protein
MVKRKMKKISTLHTEWMKDADYRKEYELLEAELVRRQETSQNNNLHNSTPTKKNSAND